MYNVSQKTLMRYYQILGIAEYQFRSIKGRSEGCVSARAYQIELVLALLLLGETEECL